jgi:hypothetical protein
MNWTESAAREVAAEVTRQAKAWHKANQTMEGFQASPSTIALLVQREWERESAAPSVLPEADAP